MDRRRVVQISSKLKCVNQSLSESGNEEIVRSGLLRGWVTTRSLHQWKEGCWWHNCVCKATQVLTQSVCLSYPPMKHLYPFAVKVAKEPNVISLRHQPGCQASVQYVCCWEGNQSLQNPPQQRKIYSHRAVDFSANPAAEESKCILLASLASNAFILVAFLKKAYPTTPQQDQLQESILHINHSSSGARSVQCQRNHLLPFIPQSTHQWHAGKSLLLCSYCSADGDMPSSCCRCQ